MAYSLAERTYLDMAKECRNEHDYEKAIHYLKKISPNSEICEMLGELFYSCGNESDKAEAEGYFKQAEDYFRWAAKEGNFEAMCNYAYFCADSEEKLMYYKRAADAGIGYAMNMVGILMEKKCADADDPKEKNAPAAWFRKAADAGEPVGAYNYSFYTDDEEEKKQYLKQAADAGYTTA